MDRSLLYSHPAFSQFLTRVIVEDLFPDFVCHCWDDRVKIEGNFLIPSTFFFNCKSLVWIPSVKASPSWLLTSVQLLPTGRRSTLKTFSLQQFHSSLVCAQCDTWWAALSFCCAKGWGSQRETPCADTEALCFGNEAGVSHLSNWSASSCSLLLNDTATL